MAESDEGFWPAFRRGLTSPSLAGLVVTLAVAAAWILASVTLSYRLTPRFMADGFYRIIASGADQDERCFLTGETLAFREGLVPPPDVLVYGTSSIRQAVDNGRGLARELSERTGRDITVVNHATGALTLWEIEALVATLPDSFPGAVVIALSPTSAAVNPTLGQALLTTGRDNWALPLASWSEVARHTGATLPESTGSYFWDNAAFFLVRLRNLPFRIAVGNFPPVVRSYRLRNENAAQSEAQWRRGALEAVEPLADKLNRNEKINEATLHRIVADLERRGARVMLVDSPINPRFVEGYIPPDTYRQYLAMIRRVATDLELPLVDLNEAAALQEAEFHDVMHVVGNDVRRRCQTVLAEKLVEAGYFEDREPTP